MFWKKKKETLKSEEYIELKDALAKLKLEVKSLELDLLLYVKRLKASKGLTKKDTEEDKGEDENYFNKVIFKS